MNLFEYLGIILIIVVFTKEPIWYFGLPILLFASFITLYLGEAIKEKEA